MLKIITNTDKKQFEEQVNELLNNNFITAPIQYTTETYTEVINENGMNFPMTVVRYIAFISLQKGVGKQKNGNKE